MKARRVQPAAGKDGRSCKVGRFGVAGHPAWSGLLISAGSLASAGRTKGSSPVTDQNSRAGPVGYVFPDTHVWKTLPQRVRTLASVAFSSLPLWVRLRIRPAST